MGTVVLRCGKIFNGVDEKLHSGLDIQIENETITKISPKIVSPPNAEIIDLSGLTVTPGLIDAHVHFDFAGSAAAIPGVIYDSDECKAINILYCARRALEGGFTTVRLAGADLTGYGAVDARRAIEKGMFEGARLVVAPHALGSSGSHGDHSIFLAANPALSDAQEARFKNNLGNGADFFKKAVRKEIKYGADYIKIIPTGGFATPSDGPEDMQLDNDELKAIIDTARNLFKSVTAHAYSSKLVTNLANLGITGIEHGALIDEQTLEVLKKNGVYLVPTFMPYEDIINIDEEKLAKKNKAFREKLRLYSEQLRTTRKLLVREILAEELTIGYGTDIVAVYDNFECWREFKAWRGSGISALRTLKAATSVNAKIIEHPELGTLAVGKTADIAGWSRDILNDHEAISECAFVMKNGKIFKR